MSKFLAKMEHSYWPIFMAGNFNALLNLLLPLILVRHFGPEEMGLYKIFFLYVSLIPFFTMTSGILTSFYYWIGNKEEFKGHSRTIWQLTNAISFGALMPVFLIVFLLLNGNDFYWQDIALISISSILGAPTGLMGEYSMARGRSNLSLALGTSFEFIKVSGFIALALHGYSINSIFRFYTIMMICSFIFTMYLAYKDDLLRFKINKAHVKEIFAYSMPISISAALVVIIEKADQLILASYLSTVDYAYYSLGCLIVPSVLILEGSVQKKLIPKLSEYYKKSEFEDLERILKKGIENIAFLTVPSVFGLILYSDAIIEILYTSTYAQASIYLAIFSTMYLMYLIPHDSILRATGKTGLLLKVNIYFAIISLGIISMSAIYTNAIVTLTLSIVLKILYRIYVFNISAKMIHINVLNFYRSFTFWNYFLVSSILSISCFLLNFLFENKILSFAVNGSLFAVIYLFYFVKIKKINLSLN